ncbi:MAG: ribosomal RNA small subunit methyltransferase A, partial [Candidatus Aminicenantes bacterium]|nr:ribosomal RNA small subunit methyltransferase A [Candidatus Aminicenantes bacterium]
MKKSKRKALGQHFLVDRMVLKKIANTIDPQQEDFIIEIGAGKGALTFFLAKKANKVIAIEKDKSLIPALKRKDFPNLTVLEKDVLKLEFKDFTKREKVKLVGNLPYSISSPILFKVLAEKDLFSECTFLL